MKYDIYFNEAKNIGVNDLELYISSSSKLSFSLFHGELDNAICPAHYSDSSPSVQAWQAFC